MKVKRNKDGKKVIPEDKTRKILFDWAKEIGCAGDLVSIFNKYDRLLSTVRNPEERKAISALGAVEVHKLFGGYSDLEVDGIHVAKDPNKSSTPEADSGIKNAIFNKNDKTDNNSKA